MSSAAPIADIVQDVIASDVAAYGVGWPDKVPPPLPTTWTNGGETVEIPVTDHGLAVSYRTARAVSAISTTTVRAFAPWIALAVVAVLVAGVVLTFATHQVSPGPARPATASATASAASGCGQPAATTAGAPIVAIFDQATFSTTYEGVVSGAGCDALTLQWGGPNCGTWSPQQPQKATGPEAKSTMVWYHPHPPCDPTTDHSDVTVTLAIGYSGGTIVCSYQGAASGTGPACGKP